MMALLGDIRLDVQTIESYWRTTMAKRKTPRLTAEELARRAETTKMLEERIAYHEAKAREEEAARGRRRKQ